MDLTKFRKLKEIVALLGADPVEAALVRDLAGEGVDLDHPERIIVGQTGLYYVDPSGLVTRVLLYIVDANIAWQKGRIRQRIRNMISQKDFDNPDLVNICHKYHILNCATQKQAQIEGWSGKYKAAQRLNGTFFYRFLDGENVLEEVKEQHLDVCGHCLRLLNDITGKQYEKKGFTPDIFFSLNLSFIKRPQVNPHSPPPPNIYPPDWNDISARYRKIKSYQCEGEKCPHPDLSATHLRQYLHCHHIDREKQHSTFFNLKALCVYCHAKQPQHGHMKNSKQIKEYLLKIERAIKPCPSCSKKLLITINKANRCPSCGMEFR